MRHIATALLATTALFVGLSQSASAADMRVPYRASPPPAPAYFSWTGCYFGGHIGGLWAHKDRIDHEPGDRTFGASEGTHNPSGFLGGLQGGCDYQFAGGFVLGIAGDHAWADAESSNLSLLFPGFTNHSKVKSLSSVTGRLGYAWDRLLGYVKGGGAWERDEYDYTNGVIIGTARETRGGWTVGVGAEYAFTNFVSGFIEYNYYDFGDRNVTFLENTGFTYTAGIKETKNVVKAGLNFRFGGYGSY
jgi:outer membrane immunogenic protein